MAIVVRGKCLGLKSIQGKDKSKAPMIVGGVSFQTEGGFDGQDTVIEIRFFPKQIEEGLHHAFQTYRGSLVEVPVKPSLNAYNGRTSLDYNCSGPIVQVKPALAEVPPRAAKGGNA